MSKVYLTRRDFIKASAVAAGITAYAAKVAGAREAESPLETKSDNPESTLPDRKSIDPRYLELVLQHRSAAISYRDLHPNYNVHWMI